MGIHHVVGIRLTRINCVPPSELTRQHLIAEYRELPRIFGLVRAAVERGEQPSDRRNPQAYTLGTGHCRFFYSRLGWLSYRQACLIAEMKRRGYSVNFSDVAGLIVGIPWEWFGAWEPDHAALAINRARIQERLDSG